VKRSPSIEPKAHATAADRAGKSPVVSPRPDSVRTATGFRAAIIRLHPAT